jgi:hypothetical protein
MSRCRRCDNDRSRAYYLRLNPEARRYKHRSARPKREPMVCQYCGGDVAPRSKYPTCRACKGKHPQYNARCEICGKPFKRRKDSKTGCWQRCCGRTCGQELWRRLYGTAGGTRLVGQASRVHLRRCLQCGDAFRAKRSATVRCDWCLAMRRLTKALRSMRAEAWRANPPNCVYCDKPLDFVCVGGRPNKAHAACTKEANKERGRVIRHKLRAEGKYERFTLRSIAERDGWRCHICLGPVSIKNWSLDHLEPLSKGDAHLRSNVALAHKDCNSRRGDGRIPAQLLLFG